MFYHLKFLKFSGKNLDMKQDKTEVKTRSKQKARKYEIRSVRRGEQSETRE